MPPIVPPAADSDRVVEIDREILSRMFHFYPEIGAFHFLGFKVDLLMR